MLEWLTFPVLTMLVNGVLSAVGDNCSLELNHIQLEPPDVEVEYGSSFSANCSSNSNHTDLYWTPEDYVVSADDWTDNMIFVNVTNWEIQPQCNLILSYGACFKTLPIIIYKLPERVSISTVDHAGPMAEGTHYELQCDVQNVAPLNLLTVNWYKGDDQVNQTNFTDPIKTPVNQSATLKILPEHEVEYWCEAELKLESQPHPKMSSARLKIETFCPVTLQPPSVVAVYGSFVSVNCSTMVTHEGLGWEASQGAVAMKTGVQHITWTVESLTHLDIQPMCSINIMGGQCEQTLPVTVYKLPERVSIITVNHTDEGMYELRCDVQNVAPLNLLTVNWYKGNDQVNQINFTDPIKTPVNQSATLKILHKNKVEYWCEAELKLESQPHPKMTSRRLEIETFCPVKLQPSELVVEYGETASVNCSTSVSHGGMGWEASQGAVPMRQVQHIIWKVENLSHIDIRPICYLNRRDEEQCSKTLPIIVYKLPDKISLITNHTGQMIEGRTYGLQCIVQNVTPVHLLVVNWYKGKNLISRKYFSEVQKTLLASQRRTVHFVLNRSDNGVQFWCEAELKLEQHGLPNLVKRSGPLTIRFDYVPKIEALPSSLVVKKDGNVSLPCIADGNPYPQVLWSFQNPNQTLQKNLTITWATSYDAGVYTCTAKNHLGSDTRKVLIMVADKASIITVNHTGPMIEGRRYVLQCDVLNVDPVYLLTMNWYKGDNLVTSTGFTDSNKTSLNQRRILRIIPSRTDDKVQYKCEAVLKGGPDGVPITVTSDPLDIIVHYAPKIKSITSSLVVNKDGNVSLTCIAEGNPYPQVGWSFQNSTGINGGQQETLTILRARPADARVYTCTARNKMGNDTRKVSLMVADKASIITVNHTGPMIEGRRYALQCDVLNVDPVYLLTMNWYKGDNLVTSTGFTDSNKTSLNQRRILRIIPSRTDDKVQYKCEAVLKGGPDGVPITVTSDPLDIIVHYKASIITMNHTGPMTEGRRYALHCHVQNVDPVHLLTVKWYKGDDLISNSGFTDSKKEILNQHNILQIFPDRNNNGSQYSCEAVLKDKLDDQQILTVMSDPLTITVHYAPKIKPLSTPLYVVKDGKISLNCIVQGNPHPAVWWSFQNENKTIQQETLIIERANHADAGLYTCTARNEIGNDTMTVLLTVGDRNSQNIAYIAILLIVLIILFIVVVIYCCVHKKRSGKYDIHGNDQVLMTLMNKGKK